MGYYPQREQITLLTSAGGAETSYGANVLSGEVRAVKYTKTDFANGVDILVSAERTSETILDKHDVNASATYYPRVTLVDTSGDAITNSHAPVVLVNDRVKVTVANGGAAKTGTVDVILG